MQWKRPNGERQEIDVVMSQRSAIFYDQNVADGWEYSMEDIGGAIVLYISDNELEFDAETKIITADAMNTFGNTQRILNAWMQNMDAATLQARRDAFNTAEGSQEDGSAPE